MFILHITPPFPSFKPSLKLWLDIFFICCRLSCALFCYVLLSSPPRAWDVTDCLLPSRTQPRASFFLAPYLAFPPHQAICLCPCLLLPSFNPYGSGSVAMKEAHFTRTHYRSVSRRRRQSLCSTARAFKTVSVQQQGHQSRTVEERTMIAWLLSVIVVCAVQAYICVSVLTVSWCVIVHIIV